VKKLVFCFFLTIAIGFTACNDDDDELDRSIIGTWVGGEWTLRTIFDGVVNSELGSDFDGILELNADNSFSFTESTDIVDNIFDSFEFPESGTYEELGSGFTRTLIFNPGDDDETLMDVFRTDSTLTLTWRDEVRRNGGINDIEINLLFRPSN